MSKTPPKNEQETPVKRDDPAEGSRENVNVPFPEEQAPRQEAPGRRTPPDRPDPDRNPGRDDGPAPPPTR